ncbi:hypothetical protein OJF2_30160 [Aquisphaera giovannonii]|uniref:Uncharacterized protein n=1 Tax=Aquisphaera giovannonii TaxID=406548 RepID=A0A5B9W2N1_9BACT|nr:hypothetical protein OJF2_30160 [Aquisphaera giovannonii]
MAYVKLAAVSLLLGMSFESECDPCHLCHNLRSITWRSLFGNPVGPRVDEMFTSHHCEDDHVHQ